VAGFVETTVNDIDSRLQELQEEVVKLQAARAALVGGGASRRGPGRPPRAESAAAAPAAPAAPAAKPAPASARRTRRQGRPRGRRGGNTRSNQALELVRVRGGITIPQIAEELKIEPNYLYRVMPKLVDDGLIRRDGNGWFPVEAPAAE
jgi:hypothetical protein